MASQTFTSQGHLSILLATLSLYVLHTYGSPVQSSNHNDANSNVCPKGWLHHERFCVTKGMGFSDREVATYCGGFGGIGIKGLCIVKARVDSTGEDSAVSLENDVLDNAGNDVTEFRDEMVCPQGWKHYWSMCVYKPFSTAEICQLMDAVEFSGLCLKHANAQNVTRPSDIYTQDKRLCCCANVKGRHNRYGC